MKLEVHPLTPARWPDLEALFGCRGGSVARNCWCMYYRQTGNASVASGAERRAARKRALHDLVKRGTVPGLIGYDGATPVGWISLGPRQEYAKLQSSPVMKPVDDAPVWSIVCFFVDPRYRDHGVADALLKAAIRYARSRDAKVLEAYPVDKPARGQPENLWFGAKSMFDKAGFREIARRKPARPIVRKVVGSARSAR